MQREGRNGIWHFILSNSYRPGIVKHQFNCILSNPPWLAMSKLADNPYKRELRIKCEQYGIQPPGAAHLHIELASTFLLNAIDKYLINQGVWYCVMPGSILSGYNHERLRRREFQHSQISISAVVDELWELPKQTFKNKAIVLGGRKGPIENHNELVGRIYSDSNTFNSCEYTLRVQGRRSAWSNQNNQIEFENLINPDSMIFKEGADVFPRTALFHEFQQQANGEWSINIIGATSNKYYLVNDSKKQTCRDVTGSNFDKQYMHKCFISKHMSPFYACNAEDVIIPGTKINGLWTGITEQDLALMNTSTRNIFKQMQEEMGISLKTWLMNKINIREKLESQKFHEGSWLVLSNAGGENPCAAYIYLDDTTSSRLIIDQTLYWYVASSEEEAQYIVGLLNSMALAEAIMDFQPQGEFGRRHIHTLPYKIMPRYDITNPAHEDVVVCTQKLMD